MTTPEGEEPEVGVADLEWVWDALPPDLRRDRLRALARWVEWVTVTYDLDGHIPPCWYRHRAAVSRLTAAWVAWLRTYVEDGPTRPTALVEFHDALDRTVATLGLPKKCLEGLHPDGPGDTGAGGFEQWLATAGWVTAPPTHPTPEFISPGGQDAGASDPQTGITRMPTPEMHQHAADGAAVQLGRGDAYHFRGAWWIGDGGSYVRIDDPEFAADLDRKADRLAAAENTRSRHPSNNPANDPSTRGGERGTPGEGGS